jgi:hypothetical protein
MYENFHVLYFGTVSIGRRFRLIRQREEERR